MSDNERPMERRFLIDKIKSPKTRDEKIDVLVALGFWRITNGADNLRMEQAHSMDDMTENLSYATMKLNCADMLEDEDFRTEVFNRFQVDDVTVAEYYGPVALAFHSIAETYVFQKDFFNVLRKARLKNLDWSMVPSFDSCCIRFPIPFAVSDEQGNPSIITDVFVCCVEWDDACEMNIIFDGSSNIVTAKGREIKEQRFATQFNRPRSGPLDLIENDWSGSSFAELNNILLKMLVYLASGNPDLREFRNPIKYQSAGSTKPVRAHKDFSQLPYKVVGYNWLKERQTYVDAWGVEPFMRLQPVGPGRKEYKYVLVRAHTRQRRKRAAIEVDMQSSEHSAEARP